MRQFPNRRRRGFTMIEMLVVFVVFGAVMLVSVRAVGDTLRRDRAAKVAAILGSDLEQGFAIAARQRMPTRIKVDRVNKKFTIFDRNNTSMIYKTRSFASSGDYAIDSIASNRDYIDVMPNGIATDTLSLKIIIKTTGGALYYKTVRSSKGGLVRVDNR